MTLTPEDTQRIEEAIRAAEATTSGEIFCVVTERVASWWETPLIAAGLAALALPAVALLSLPMGAMDLLAGGWSTGHVAAAETAARAALVAYAVTQALVFGFTWFAVAFTPLRRWLTPEGVRRRRMHQAAMAQFLAHGLGQTRERTGVLIFASLADREAEVLADAGIHAKVGETAWIEAMEALVDGMARGQPGEGFAAAIERCGAVLAEHFPPREDNPDELPNHLVRI